MAEDIQHLLEKINREGVEKARGAAEAILSEAKAQAEALVKEAQEKASAEKVAAEKAAAAYEARAKETLSQAARDVVLNIEKRVTTLLEKYLLKAVDAALKDPEKVADLAVSVVKELAQGDGVEVAAKGALVEALRARFQAEATQGVTVVMDETLETGFSVRLEGGRVEHDFTGAAVSAELARRLRPDLAALV